MITFSLNQQLGILASSLTILAIVIAAPVLRSTASSYQTPMEKLLSNIPSGCNFENETDVSPSPINSGIDHIIVIRCLE